jgi:hypothetical protein
MRDLNNIFNVDRLDYEGQTEHENIMFGNRTDCFSVDRPRYRNVAGKLERSNIFF